MGTGNSLWKTTSIIWTDYEPRPDGLVDLARDAESGNALTTAYHRVEIDDPFIDPDWHEDIDDFFGLREREDDGPGREYVEAFNAHVRAQDARKAFPFTTRGVGKPPTILELIRLNSFVQRMLGNANEGQPIVCEYQVGYDVQEAVFLHGYHDEKNPFGRDEHYYQSWRSAVKAWQEYFAKYGALEDAEIWIFLDMFNVDAKLEFSRQIDNFCLLSLYQGEVGMYHMYHKDLRGLVEPPQP